MACKESMAGAEASEKAASPVVFTSATNYASRCLLRFKGDEKTLLCGKRTWHLPHLQPRISLHFNEGPTAWLSTTATN
eukprot:scaffold137996_cov17-Tisochrysis_lutea.AAC.1